MPEDIYKDYIREGDPVYVSRIDVGARERLLEERAFYYMPHEYRSARANLYAPKAKEHIKSIINITNNSLPRAHQELVNKFNEISKHLPEFDCEVCGDPAPELKGDTVFDCLSCGAKGVNALEVKDYFYRATNSFSGVVYTLLKEIHNLEATIK